MSMETPYKETVRAMHRRITFPSRYIENLTLEKDIYVCPRCEHDLIEAYHHKEIICRICGLHITVVGNQMEIWE